MTNEQISLAIAHTLKWEGGYVNHPNDPGGETNFGITKAQYPTVDIKNLTKEQAIEIYRADYVPKVHLNDITVLRSGWKLFDMSVNMGYSGIKLIQKLLGLTADGNFGPKSIAAINSMEDGVFVLLIADAQARHYKALALNNRKLEVFLKGWLNRAADTGIDIFPKNIA